MERNNRLISLGITLLFAASLFLLFLFIKIITPIPPFEESQMGGLEVNFGFDVAGMGSNNTLTPVKTDAASKAASSAQETSKASDSEMLTSEEESTVISTPVKKKKEKVKEPEPVPQPDQALLKALNKVHTRPGSNTGDGNTNTPGNQGDPNGTLSSNVYSPFEGKGGIRGKLRGSGRKMIGDVEIHDNSQETGIVAVEILVDKYGKIIKAEPVLIGSTTTSSLLWKKAKDGLINQVLFNQSPNGEEARGTIYINFTVR